MWPGLLRDPKSLRPPRNPLREGFYLSSLLDLRHSAGLISLPAFERSDEERSFNSLRRSGLTFPGAPTMSSRSSSLLTCNTARSSDLISQPRRAASSLAPSPSPPRSTKTSNELLRTDGLLFDFFSTQPDSFPPLRCSQRCLYSRYFPCSCSNSRLSPLVRPSAFIL